MNVLLLGSGGREHALCWALSASPLLSKLHASPGNAGICDTAKCTDLDLDDHEAIVRFCEIEAIDLTVIGPEAPLVTGLSDRLSAAGMRVFGPSRAAAQLEGSKRFTKALCAEAGIPTAAYRAFQSADSAKVYVREKGAPMVIKADGLAAGKGVTVAQTINAAFDAIDDCFSGKFGDAGSELIVEDVLIGEEASFFALVNGETVLPLATAQDHKRAYDGDLGPNTGGMGAYSPAPVMTETMCKRTMEEIVNPTVQTMVQRGIPYKGILYAGLMITADGPKLIEYNVRFGDPECQVLMMRLKSDLLAAMLATVDGTLGTFSVEWYDEAALTVVMAAQGYPGAYEKGSVIRGLEAASSDPNVEIFHAGTARPGKDIVAAGGRVLNVTARGSTVREAQAKAYQAVKTIDWPNGFYRSDIGRMAIEREENAA